MTGQSEDTSADVGDSTHQSAGEGGLPSDMDYYRIHRNGGAIMLLSTIGLPVAIILLVLFVVLVAF